MNAKLCRAHRPVFPLGASLLLAAVLLGPSAVRAQVAQDLDAIHTAEQQHRPPAEVGLMWAHLASEYGNSADFLKAEDAYNHSLHLLKDVPDAKPVYAITLDNLASLYLVYGRVDEAEEVRKQALAIRQKIGNAADIGVGEVLIADIAIAKRQYKKAEEFALRGMKDMSSSSSPPKIVTLSALITVTYARCSRGHTAEGLSSAQQAFDLANTHFEPNSPAMGFALQTLGYAEWKSGATEEGGRNMQRGLQILRSKLAASDPRLTGALKQYADYLVTTRQRQEADEIRDEVARMNSRAGVTCPACTVSVYSLAKGLR